MPVLYLTRNGLLEPLGQSQVFAYLRGLSQEYRITLITYEKDHDRTDSTRVSQVRAECEALGIRWLPQRFRFKPRVIAPVLSMMRMIWLALRETRRSQIRLIHARSYIPAAAALIVYRLTGVPFIFDMRALWPEELITAGRFRRGSLFHRVIVALERACLRNAAGVVSLTHAAVDYLHQEYPKELEDQRICVIPTCADLKRFKPSETERSTERVYGCIGSVLSGWFRLNWLSAFFSAAAIRDAGTSFEIITRDNAVEVRRRVDPDQQLGNRLTICSRPSGDMHHAIQGHDVSAMFYAGGEVSELGRSPTRMAEVLACGLPVAANSGVGDVARIISQYRVGVLVEGSGAAEMQAALEKLDRLLEDPGLASRCRAAAEAVFSLEVGTEAYGRLYGLILKESVNDRECAG